MVVLKPYKSPAGAVFQAWRPGHWASWMFEVDRLWAVKSFSCGPLLFIRNIHIK
jgi:hypothetical protein